MRKWIFLAVAILPATAFAQSNDTQSMRADLGYLASDELEGRRPGTEGIELAKLYIQSVLNKHTDSVWTQPFQIAENMSAPEASNGLFRHMEGAVEVSSDEENQARSIIKVNMFSPNQLFPVRASSNGEATGELAYAGFGITAPELEHDDYDEADVEGKIALIDISSPDGIHPHSQYMQYHGLDYRVRNAAEHGAIGVIFIKQDQTANPPRKNFTSVLPAELPAVFFNGDASELLEKNELFTLRVNLSPTFSEAENILAWKDNGAPTTLVIGAHYDHLGYGGENSLYRGETLEIHNGADDNASGTTGLLWLSEALSDEDLQHNLLFIAFSGEERGLLGSDYFTKSDQFENFSYVAMFNMDMIGRLSEERELLISGTGTAAEWDEMIENLNTYDFAISKSAGGTGASDHTSFYQMDIPVLHFFTGTHNDYHKPSDDADKINYEGMLDVARFIADFAKAIPSEMTFQKTADENSQSTPRFNVTLGIIPDYVFGGPGVKVDGVTDGKPAQKAGVETGDVIVKLGDFPTTDIYAYMRALGAFQPGQTITVTVERDGEELEMELTF